MARIEGKGLVMNIGSYRVMRLCRPIHCTLRWMMQNCNRPSPATSGSLSLAPAR